MEYLNHQPKGAMRLSPKEPISNLNMDKTRLIVIGVDDIARLFKDYAGGVGSIPEDAQCDTLLFNRQEKLMCLRLTSQSWVGAQAPENIRFDLQRTFMVGGNARN